MEISPAGIAALMHPLADDLTTVIVIMDSVRLKFYHAYVHGHYSMPGRASAESCVVIDPQ